MAVDTGGTFTDFFVRGPAGIRVHKVISTPRDPSRAILQGLKELGIPAGVPLVHGSTVATNALLEGKGARVLLVTSAGFEDVLAIGRQNRPSLYDLNADPLPPLVPRGRRLGVRERISVQGKVLQALSAAELKRLQKKIKVLRFDSVAVCLLAAFADPRHERLLEKALARPGLPVSLSSEICPEFREYERSSTTCINAYVAPVMSRYLARLKENLKRPLSIMQSNGGALSAEEAAREAVRTLLSGPAGGALGALQAGKAAGRTRLLTLDMGGTSTDMSLIDGELELTSEGVLAGRPVKTPMIRIDTIGAGGGSLAWVDAGGALRVGPQSAGADPGPISYGRGGRGVTLTDAHLFLGRLHPRSFLGGRMKISRDKIVSPLEKLARSLKISAEETAEGIVQIANANMARALRVLSLERGYDPGDFTLLAFGGAGGLHACELAEDLGIPEVVIPPDPGILSAFGMAFADWVRDYVQTVLLDRPSAAAVKKTFASLRARALRDAQAQRIETKKLIWRERVDVRYRGQSYELTVDFAPDFQKRFVAAHRRSYGFVHAGRDVEIVNVRLQARYPAEKPGPAVPSRAARTRAPAARDSATLRYGGKSWDAGVFPRAELAPPTRLSGPALIPEYSASTLLPPGWTLRAHPAGSLILKREGR